MQEEQLSRAAAALEHSDELALVQRAATEADAFGALYERYVRRIYNYIYYRTGNHHDAEDLTARVFQRAMRHVGSFEDKGVPFSAWLYRIAHNLVANWHRDRSRRPLVPLDDRAIQSGGHIHPEMQAVAAEEEALLLTAVRRLPAERQQLLILKFVERLSNADIGRIMGRTEGAIKSLYHRTLNSLRDELSRPPSSNGAGQSQIPVNPGLAGDSGYRTGDSGDHAFVSGREE